MDDAKLQTLAQQLAKAAVTKDKAPLEKIALDVQGIKSTLMSAASNPHLRNAALGAGAGGLLGLATGGKDKKRNALHYALLGGLGAGGLSLGAGALDKLTAPPPREVSAPVTGTVGPVMRGLGAGAAGLAAAAGLGLAGTAGRRVYANIARGRGFHGLGRAAVNGIFNVGQMDHGRVMRHALRSFERTPLALRLGVPLAAAGAAWQGMQN